MNTRRLLVTGLLGLTTAPGNGNAPGAVTGFLSFTPTGNSPLVWGLVGNGFLRTESVEEALDILRAAYYQLGIPQEEWAQMSRLVRQAGFTSYRTQAEYTWRSALTPYSRTEQNDRDWMRMMERVAARNAQPGGYVTHARPLKLAQLEGIALN